MTTAKQRTHAILQEVEKERSRQRTSEGWSLAHDQTHVYGELAILAAIYAVNHTDAQVVGELHYADEWVKLKDTRRNLIRAAALLVAEIEREDAQSDVSTSNEELKRHAEDADDGPNHRAEVEASMREMHPESDTIRAIADAALAYYEQAFDPMFGAFVSSNVDKATEVRLYFAVNAHLKAVREQTAQPVLNLGTRIQALRKALSACTAIADQALRQDEDKISGTNPT